MDDSKDNKGDPTTSASQLATGESTTSQDANANANANVNANTIQDMQHQAEIAKAKQTTENTTNNNHSAPANANANSNANTNTLPPPPQTLQAQNTNENATPEGPKQAVAADTSQNQTQDKEKEKAQQTGSAPSSSGNTTPAPQSKPTETPPTAPTQTQAQSQEPRESPKDGQAGRETTSRSVPPAVPLVPSTPSEERQPSSEPSSAKVAGSANETPPAPASTLAPASASASAPASAPAISNPSHTPAGQASQPPGDSKPPTSHSNSKPAGTASAMVPPATAPPTATTATPAAKTEPQKGSTLPPVSTAVPSVPTSGTGPGSQASTPVATIPAKARAPASSQPHPSTGSASAPSPASTVKPKRAEPSVPVTWSKDATPGGTQPAARKPGPKAKTPEGSSARPSKAEAAAGTTGSAASAAATLRDTPWKTAPSKGQGNTPSTKHEAHQPVNFGKSASSPMAAAPAPSPTAAIAAGMQQSPPGSQGYRQLKVEDALAYLEQVKTQFASLPHVYNQFLDIMKEFKAQTIGTIEVIKRVSLLFRGHRNLILGFNTFLPPGYKIEMREDANTGITTTGFSGPSGFSSLSIAPPPPRPPVPPQATGYGVGPQAVGYVTPTGAPPPSSAGFGAPPPQPPGTNVGPPMAQGLLSTPTSQRPSGQAAANGRGGSAPASVSAVTPSKTGDMRIKTEPGVAQTVAPSPGTAPMPPGVMAASGRAEYGPMDGSGMVPPGMAPDPRMFPLGPAGARPLPQQMAPVGVQPGQPGQPGQPVALVSPMGASPAGGIGMPPPNVASMQPASSAAVPPGSTDPNYLEPGSTRHIEFNQAITYVNKIKNRFSGRQSVYRQFLEILHTYQKEQKSIKEVYEQVAELFHDHADLLEEFTMFLPGPPPTAPVPVGQLTTPGPAAKAKPGPSPSKKAVPATGKRPRRTSQIEPVQGYMFANQPGTTVGAGQVPAIPPASMLGAVVPTVPPTAPVLLGNPSAKRPKTGSGFGTPGMPPSSTAPAAGAPTYSPTEKAKSKKLDSKKKDKNAALAPSQMAPGAGAASKLRNLATMPAEFQLFNEIRMRLSDNPLVYKEFIKYLDLLSKEIISKQELNMIAEEILGKWPALLKAFVSFVENAGSTLGDTSSALLKEDEMVARMGGNYAMNGIMMHPGDLDEHSHIFGTTALSSSIASSSSLGNQLRIDGQPYEDALANPKLAARLQMMRSRPMSEIAAESSIKSTESYKRLPADFPMPVCSGKTDLDRKTLNDLWVSVPVGSEDYSTRGFRKNQYEENIFRCEDDRYELDMVIETNAATITRLEPIAATIAKLSPEDKKKHALAQGALGPVHFRAIERIYGDHGAEVVEQVKVNPSVAIPVVLTRLKQKDEHWRRARLEMNKIWREVCEKNYLKSLDHRSFNFKQLDKREWSSKIILSELTDPQVAFAARQTCVLHLGNGYPTIGVAAMNRAAPVSGAHIKDSEDVAKQKVDVTTTTSVEAAIAEKPDPFRLSSLLLEKLGPDSPIYPVLASVNTSKGLAYFLGTGDVHHIVFGLLLFSLQYECSNPAEHAIISKRYWEFFSKLLDTELGSSSDFKWIVSDVDTKEVSEVSIENQVGKSKTPAAYSWLQEESSKRHDPDDEAPYVENKPSKNFNTLQLYGGRSTSPIAMDTDMVGAGEESDHEKSFSSSVLFADENLYILLRVYRCLVERIAFAKKLAMEQAKVDLAAKQSEAAFTTPQSMGLVTYPPSSLSHQSVLPSESDKNNAANGVALSELLDNPKELLARLAKHRFDSFMDLLKAFLSVNVDATRYEDHAREILGSECYALCTMDKLVTKFVKLSQSCFGPHGNPSTQSLIRLYLAEAANPANFMEDLYLSRVCYSIKWNEWEIGSVSLFRAQIVQPKPGATAVVMAKELEDSAAPLKSLGVILFSRIQASRGLPMEPTDTNVDIVNSSAVEAFNTVTGFKCDHGSEDPTILEGDDAERSITAREIEEARRRAETLFNRWIRHSCRCITKHLSLNNLMKNATILNCLESKWCSKSRRIIFVDDDREDVFFRPRFTASDNNASKSSGDASQILKARWSLRSKKFGEWIEKRFQTISKEAEARAETEANAETAAASASPSAAAATTTNTAAAVAAVTGAVASEVTEPKPEDAMDTKP
mmetsp:Transcript_15747/g.27617  ORF Transcript_15747/g.27617 Transcript_15747/m.27617 type:complete len:2133 (+) Transcript_15747:330-6728(+)|eukprot:CAMPEP_0184695506 /NCGR_PEP_ID=MMETSP0313-20130426/3109_1 /TAXON_ID=2792 /ORGANISM="Porphyridium aerugineum, Strain SAG 1380-2" /LENGTH=2132 /DNA_ID=CAMNT_0027153973 /DNA_START=274 /DNA_END=6672 /DNA_ORIENTATION=+